MNQEHTKYLLNKCTAIKDNIVRYVSGKLDSDERNTIEESLFSEIVFYRMMGIATERKPEFQIKYELDILNKKIESSNQLLRKVLIILNGLILKNDK
jgi:hypothetical protein